MVSILLNRFNPKRQEKKRQSTHIFETEQPGTVIPHYYHSESDNLLFKVTSHSKHSHDLHIKNKQKEVKECSDNIIFCQLFNFALHMCTANCLLVVQLKAQAFGCDHDTILSTCDEGRS